MVNVQENEFVWPPPREQGGEGGENGQGCGGISGHFQNGVEKLERAKKIGKKEVKKSAGQVPAKTK